jgi:hypothetical protein
VFAPGNPFQPSLMYVGTARRLPNSGAGEMSSTQVGSGLTRNQYSRLESLAMEKTLAFLKKTLVYYEH